MPVISIVDFDPTWADTFAQLRQRVLDVLDPAPVTIEHVGSTSVDGLAAKPVIDMSVFVADDDAVLIAIEQLATIGYRHRGDLGVEGREAFHAPPGSPAHHLYVGTTESLGLRNHLAVRDYLRGHPEAVREYGALKKQLAAQHADDIDSYIDGKTDFLLRILADSSLSHEDLRSVEASNRKKS